MEYAIQERLYELTPRESSAFWRKHVEALPTCAFAAMQAGASYLFRRSSYASSSYASSSYASYGRSFPAARAFRVKRLTPAGGQALVRAYDESGNLTAERRIYAGDYRGALHRIDGAFIQMIGVTHEALVREAIRRSLHVPARVRCHYPLLFVDLPERFAERSQGRHSLGNVLTGTPRLLSADDVREMIRRTEDRFIRDRRLKREFAARSKEQWASYERIEERVMADLDFYYWLLPHVEEDGIFHTASRDSIS